MQIETSDDAIDAYLQNDDWRFADREATWRWMFDRGVDAERERSIAVRDALQSLVAVARRYLPDYDEHPEVQRADAALTPNAE